MTNEFEKLHKGREWDGDYFDEIDKFIDAKCKSKPMKRDQLNTLSNEGRKALEDEIYTLLMQNPEMGMGEMGECRQAAVDVVGRWIEKSNVKLQK